VTKFHKRPSIATTSAGALDVSLWSFIGSLPEKFSTCDGAYTVDSGDGDSDNVAS
jgi:hypothetical protein